ncbi:MAG: ribonuclease J [Candidatus Lokiarchaeota archaeon]|nr:ribonuclease J [Candidatus Lokiarchaeota archaeon]
MYDGLDSVGGNKIYLEEKGKGVFLDFGLNFKAYNQFYKNFLSERAIRGVHDLYMLDLIPKIDNYRSDLIPRDLNLSRHPKLNVKAVFISHAHKDHYGNLGLLDVNIPVIGSSETLALLKGLSDASTPQLGSDVVYYAERSAIRENASLISARKNFKQRSLVCTKRSSQLYEFLSLKSKHSKNIEEGRIISLDSFSLPFEVRAYEVDHSIYGSTAFLLEGDTTVAYTGDFRVHGKHAKKSEDFFSEARRASVLVIEGTRANSSERTDTEEDIFHNCLDKCEQSKGLVVANFSSNNLERLEIFREVANSVDRQLVVSPKEAYLLKALEQADDIDRARGVAVYDAIRSKTPYWEANYLDDLEKVDKNQIHANPESYIACFSYWALNNLLDINVRHGTYIYSSVRAYEEESEYDFLRLYKWMRGVFGFEIVGFDVIKRQGRNVPCFSKGYHASGHAGTEDLLKAIEIVDPDVLIPVHTENRVWFEKSFDNVAPCEKGKPLIL